MAEDGKPRFALWTHGSDKEPSSSGPVPPNHESLVQPGLSQRDYAEELEGELILQQAPPLRGGYADIYRGRWKRSDGVEVEVAVKVLRQVLPTSISMDTTGTGEKLEKRLKRERVVWKSVKHRNIHPLLGFRSWPSPRLVSGWCQHGNLADYLRNNPEISRQDKIQLIIQTAQGLAYLHSQSPPICHGDIKPENILLNNLHEAVLSDFGLGWVMMATGLSAGLTTSDGLQGTCNYLAPELFEEEKPRPSRESDVYAFGGLMLSVLSGKPPFAGLIPARILYRTLEGQHPRLDEHSPLKADDPLWKLMVKCWARKCDRRPIMTEVVNELKKELGYPSGSPPAPGPPPASISQGQVVGAILGTLVAYSLARRHLDPQPNSKVFSNVRGVGENAPSVSATSGAAPTQDRSEVFHWMTLHNTLTREGVSYNLCTSQDPVNSEEWVVELSFPYPFHGNPLGTFNGKGAKRIDAKNAAAKKALAAINRVHALEDEKSCEPESATAGDPTYGKP